MVSHSARDEVRRVERDDRSLCKAGFRVGLLHSRRHARNGENEREDKVDSNEGRVGRALSSAEEDVQQHSQSEGDNESSKGGADENELPHGRVGVLPLLEEGLGERVRKVDQQQEAEQDEKRGTDRGCQERRQLLSVGSEREVAQEQREIVQM